MLLAFTKMQGLGNDFVVIDNRDGSVRLSVEQRRFLADRHFGVGCDQMLMVEAATTADADFNYRIFNADGAEVGQCGNGARCFARYVRERGLIDRDQIRVRTQSGLMQLFYRNGEVSVDMGQAVFTPERIPFVVAAEAPTYHMQVGGQNWAFGAVSMGNPHVTLQVDDVDHTPVTEWGPLWQRLPAFPQSVNVGFAQRLSANHIKLRVYERGSGETLACGSGACAAVAVGRRQGWLDANVQVDLPGGSLRVQWESETAPVMMTGPAEFVFNGTIEI